MNGICLGEMNDAIVGQKNEAANYAKGDLNDEKLNENEEVEWWISGTKEVHGSEKSAECVGRRCIQ